MRPYKTINLLSLDVAAGAMISAGFFGRILHVSILPQGYLLLGLIVWLIYTADHLLDAWTMKEAAISERHAFHQRNFLSILVSLVATGVVAIGLMFLIRIQLITAGIVFGSLVIVYLLINRYLKYFKELVGSVLYTGGVLLPAWSLSTGLLNRYQVLVIIVFTLIALTNMLIFAKFSVQEDRMNNQKSIATILGEKNMDGLIWMVIGACIALMVYIGGTSLNGEVVVLFLMESILIAIFRFDYFRNRDRYRIYGDAIFLLPIILLS